MKTLIYKNTKRFTLLAAMSFILLGCGGGSGSNWGIDHGTIGTAEELSHGPRDETTGLFRCDLSDADLVEPGGVVTPLTEDTQIRVWHFQNSEEYVCTLQGQATLTQPTGV